MGVDGGGRKSGRIQMDFVLNYNKVGEEGHHNNDNNAWLVP